MKENKLSFWKTLLVYTSVVGLEWLFFFLQISPLFSLIGFRIYIPLLPMIYLIWLRIESGERFLLRPFPWALTLYVILTALLIAAGGWYFKLLKYRMPEYLYELAGSSLVDFPVYFIWNLPLLGLLWFSLRTGDGTDTVTKLLPFLLIPLFFSGYIYKEVILYKNGTDAIPLIIVLSGVFGSFYLSKTFFRFSAALFLGAWITLLLYGVQHPLLLNTFLAYQYTEWQGFFKAPQEILNYFRAGTVLAGILGLLFLSKPKN